MTGVRSEVQPTVQHLIVRAQTILHTNGLELEHHPAVRIGCEYLVVGIIVRPCGNLLRIHDDYGGPSVWPIEMFEVSTSRLPPGWEAHLRMLGNEYYLSIGPGTWLRSGFWDAFDNDAKEAVAEYGREVDHMLRDENFTPQPRPRLSWEDL
jgi:hypothetical protein